MLNILVLDIVSQGAMCPNREAAWEMNQDYDDQLAQNRKKGNDSNLKYF